MSYVKGVRPDRNTKRYEARIGRLVLHFSYGTCVGVVYHPLGILARVKNHWGPTTGRHMNEAGMRAWPEVSLEELDGLIQQALAHQGLALFKETMEGKAA